MLCGCPSLLTVIVLVIVKPYAGKLGTNESPVPLPEWNRQGKPNSQNLQSRTPERRVVLREGCKDRQLWNSAECSPHTFSCIHNECMNLRELLEAKERTSGREQSQQPLVITRVDNINSLCSYNGEKERPHNAQGIYSRMLNSLEGEGVNPLNIALKLNCLIKLKSEF